MRDTMSLLADVRAGRGRHAREVHRRRPVRHLRRAGRPRRRARAGGPGRAWPCTRRLAERAASRPDLPPLEVHVGINTGPVIAGAVGDGSQFGVMGDTINTAARLMDLASDGETFVSAETARRLRRGFRLEDARPARGQGQGRSRSPSSALLGELGPDERARPTAPPAGAARRPRRPELAHAAPPRRAQAADGDGVACRARRRGRRRRVPPRRASWPTELGGAGLAGAAGLGPRPGRDAARPRRHRPRAAARRGRRRVAGGTPGRWPRRCSPVASPRPTTSSSCSARSSTAAARETPLLVVLDDVDARRPRLDRGRPLPAAVDRRRAGAVGAHRQRGPGAVRAAASAPPTSSSSGSRR